MTRRYELLQRAVPPEAARMLERANCMLPTGASWVNESELLVPSAASVGYVPGTAGAVKIQQPSGDPVYTVTKLETGYRCED